MNRDQTKSVSRVPRRLRHCISGLETPVSMRGLLGQSGISAYSCCAFVDTSYDHGISDTD